MKLYIDTRDRKKINIAISEKNKIIISRANSQINSNTALLLLKKALIEADLEMEQISEIEVERGPGSYTGTRVGVAIANALSFALQIPINRKEISSIESPKY